MSTHESTTTALASAAYTAGLAPSVHNTQPWHWRVHPQHLDLFASRERQLGVLDPEGRLLLASCGAALHHARIALAAEGWQPTVQHMPDGHDRDHLARLTLERQVGVSPEAIRRFQAAERRRSDRRSVGDTPVPPLALAGIREAVEAEGIHLHLLPHEQLHQLAVAVSHADELANSDPAIVNELAYWVGGARPGGSGMPDTVIPSEQTHAAVRQRDFGIKGTLDAGPDTDRGATYAVIFGDDDTGQWWLRAGEALSAAWLNATEQGVALLPFSAPVEAAPTRTVLRRILSGLGHPYLVLRLGMVDPDVPGPDPTPRLDPSQTVEIVCAQR